jgi:hypothetical protein
MSTTPIAAPDIRRPQPDDDDEAPRAREAIARAAKDPNAMTPEEVVDATDFLLDDDPDNDAPLEDTVELNVGTPAKPVWMKWTIRAIEEDTLAQINRMGAANVNRQQRRQRSKAVDTTMTNARVVAAGTVYPDLTQLCRDKGIADPAMLVRMKFRRKPGLLIQLAGEVLTLSGFDDDDVRESQEVVAAGNS